MSVIHIICSDVPSCGKSFVAWQLAMHMMYNSQPLKIFDLDEKKVISNFSALNTFSIPTKQDESSDYDYTELLNRILITKTDIIVDSTYKQFDSLLDFLSADNFSHLDEIKAKDLKIVFHLPVCAGNVKEQCIQTVNNVLEKFKTTNVIAWLNHYPSSVVELNPTNDFYYSMFSDQGSLRYVVNLPRFSDSKTVTDDTCEYFLKQMWNEHKIYGQLLDTEHFAEACDPYLDNRPFVMIMAQRVGYIRDLFDEAITPLSEIIF